MLLPGATGSAIGGGSKHVFGRIFLSAVVAATISLRPYGAAAEQQTTPQTLADQAIHKLDLQTDLLADQAIHRLDLQTVPPHEAQEPQELPHVLRLPPETIWVAIIVGVVIMLYAFRDLIPVLRAGRGGAWSEDEAASLATGPRPPEVVLETADDLAARGRFVEAMHVLLLQALAEIRRRLDEEFADSMTSREILRSRQLSDALRRPLREVINRVEWTYFGGHSADRDDYLACRASFSALAQALPPQVLPPQALPPQALPRGAAA
jgi:hypothetical protein